MAFYFNPDAFNIEAFAHDPILIELGATETAVDTAAFNVNVFDTLLQLAATEQQDVATFTLDLSVSLVLDTAETAVDTAAFSVVAVTYLEIAATEQQDVAAFNIFHFDPTIEAPEENQIVIPPPLVAYAPQEQSRYMIAPPKPEQLYKLHPEHEPVSTPSRGPV